MKIRDIFHKISYLQYPMMLIGLYYACSPFIVGFEHIWANYNYFLIFTGLGISFSTFQDTTKTQNKFSKSVWENPKKGKFFLGIMSFTSLFALSMGLFGIYLSTSDILTDLSLGFIVLSIGLLGQLKVASEMFEYHRKDKS